MSLIDRQRQFLEAAQKHFGTSKAVRPRELFGVSNSAKIVEGGIQLGVVNLDNVKNDVEALILGCVLRFPPEDEVYFAVLIRNGKADLLKRLTEMRQLGGSTNTQEEDPTDELSDAIKYKADNNNVPIYLAKDGRLWMRNKGFWGSLNFDRSAIEPSVVPDQIAVALYPPTASARRSLLAREFIGWLGTLVGREKIHELTVWTDTATLNSSMERLNNTL